MSPSIFSKKSSGDHTTIPISNLMSILNMDILSMGVLQGSWRFVPYKLAGKPSGLKKQATRPHSKKGVSKIQGLLYGLTEYGHRSFTD